MSISVRISDAEDGFVQFQPENEEKCNLSDLKKDESKYLLSVY